jgi:uncharacterized repeat protein (TIGR01451 family)
MLALDLDGDGTPENTVTLKWSDLTEPAGSDLGDDDGDGMHNSWEIANGLLPNFDDSADDKDGDGASNIEEYLAGTDPNDPASAPVDLSISITDSPDPATPGVSLTYSVEVSNPGSLTAFDVVVTDALPASLSLVSATASQGSCAGTTLLSCDLGSLNGSSSAFVTIIVTPSTQGVVSNTANVTSSTPDSDLSNNSATATTTVGPAEADLSISISDSVDPVAEGETYTYRLEVQNLGPSVAADVRVENALPTGVNFVSATGNEWDCNNLSGTVVCTRPSLQAGGAAAPPISLEVTALIAGGEISNTASVSSTALDPDLGNNSATETTTVVRLAASSVNLDLGADAFDMELDAARQRLYVSVPGLNEVVIVSASNWTVLNRVVVGGSPHGIDMSQDGSVLYVALNQGGAVAVVDLSTLAVSQVPVATELDTVLAYDVSAATPNAVFVSGNPGSSGLAYIVKIDTLNSNLVTRVASDRIIRADPFFVASADQQFLYVGEGFLPQSVYKLDLAQADVPLVLEDAHGSIIWAHHLDISPDGSQLFLSSGQVLSTDTLTETGRLFDFSISIGGRVTIVSNDGTKAYVGTDPNRIDVYDISTLLKIDAFATSCAITDRVNITDIQRIIELQANVSWILLGQQTVCRVDL